MSNKDMDRQAWKKYPVKRERRHEPLVDKLCSNKEGSFTYIKDLMVFAAMVGYSKNERKELKGDGIGIILETYASDEKDAFVYLLALITERNGTILRNENLNRAINIFEEYCNAGLETIQLWFDENPGDHAGTDTLFEKIYAQVIENQKSIDTSLAPEEIEVEF